MILLVIVSAAAGLVFGRLPAAVAERVFDDRLPPLLAADDVRTPFSVETGRPLRTVWVVLATGVLWGGTAAAVGTRWVVMAYLWFVAVTLVLTLTDIDAKLIPNRILYPGVAIGAVLLVLGSVADGDAGGLLRAFLGAAVYFGGLLVLAFAARGGFGMGDVKLGVFLGLFLAYESWRVLVVGVVGAFALGGVVSLLLLVLRLKSRKDTIPFGPYLVVAAWVAIAAGTEIADWYAG